MKKLSGLIVRGDSFTAVKCREQQEVLWCWLPRARLQFGFGNLSGVHSYRALSWYNQVSFLSNFSWSSFQNVQVAQLQLKKPNTQEMCQCNEFQLLINKG